MINFDLTSELDNNGFVRLCNIHNFEKFVEMFKRMKTTIPSNPSDCLYKDYNVTTYSSHGTYNFATVCQADMFIRRIANYLPIGWVMWSSRPKGAENRVNTIMYIWKYDYCNTYRANSQTIVIKWYDGFGNMNDTWVNVDDLYNIIYRPLTEYEVERYKDYVNFMSMKPEPIYKLMVMKKEYQDNYSQYLDDCNTYGFTPLNKTLINTIRIEFEGVPTTFTTDGKLGWDPNNEDTIVVNK